MSIADLILPEYDNEITVTRTVLERVPDESEQGAWKPHEKAFPLGHLAQLVSMMPAWVPMVTDKPELDIAPKDGPKREYTYEKTAKLLADAKPTAQNQFKLPLVKRTLAAALAEAKG